ncbi:hypothetical protein CVH13_01817, partial [Dehalococcoides mccartyi]
MQTWIGGDSHRDMVFVPSGGKSVQGRVINDINLGHGVHTG